MNRSSKIFLLPLLLVAAACSNENDNLGGHSQNVTSSPKIVIEGADQQFAADIFTALGVPSTTTNGVETRQVGGLACEKSTSGGADVHRCTVNADLASAEVEQIWNALALPSMYAAGREVKAHGPLVLVDTHDEFVVVQNTGCENVIDGDLASAEKCMDFWAEVFPSYEGDFNIFGVTNAPAVKQKAVELVKSQRGRVDEARLANESLFLAAMYQESDDGDLHYFDFLPGRYPALGEVYSITITDILSPGEQEEWTFTRAEAEEWSLGFEGVKRALEFAVDE